MKRLIDHWQGPKNVHVDVVLEDGFFRVEVCTAFGSGPDFTKRLVASTVVGSSEAGAAQVASDIRLRILAGLCAKCGSLVMGVHSLLCPKCER